MGVRYHTLPRQDTKESGLRVFGEPCGILVESRQTPLMGVTWGGGTKERRNEGKGTCMPEFSVSVFG